MAAPNILCDCTGMTNEMWLKCREHGPKGNIEYTVGGSDVATIFGLSPWTVREWQNEWRRGRFNVVPKPRIYRDEFRERVMADVNKAEEVRRTALRWDLPYATVKKWFDRKVKEEATR